jgi:hypothetical protein
MKRRIFNEAEQRRVRSINNGIYYDYGRDDDYDSDDNYSYRPAPNYYPRPAPNPTLLYSREPEPETYENVLFIVDHDLIRKSLKKKNYELLHMAANNSNILCVDTDYNYYYYCMDLEVITDKPLFLIKQAISSTIVNLEMNSQHLFFMCNTKQLKILSIESFELVKVIETDANQIRLISIDYILLYDSAKRCACLYEQYGDFNQLKEINLDESIEDGLCMNRGTSKRISFYNSTCIKYVS